MFFFYGRNDFIISSIVVRVNTCNIDVAEKYLIFGVDKQQTGAVRGTAEKEHTHTYCRARHKLCESETIIVSIFRARITILTRVRFRLESGLTSNFST